MRPVLLAVSLLLGLPAAAAAQAPQPGPEPVPAPEPAPPPTPEPAPPAAPAPAPPPAPAPVSGALALSAPGVALAGERFVVEGRFKPEIAGQKVIVRFYQGAKKVRAKEMTVRKDGTFRLGHTASAGRLSIRAVHEASPEVAAVRAKSRVVTVIAPSARRGQSNASVRWLQRRLAELRFAVPRSGRFDEGTANAVMAYRKLTGIGRSQTADRAVFTRLARGVGTFKVRYPSHGRHVEGDLTNQVLALIGANGKVQRIYTTSTGKPSTPTILGSYRVYRKDPGTNSLGMYASSYFIRGYAIHGYISVPPYPASHGCLRVPMMSARSIFDWIRIGTRVDTYYR